MGFIAMNPRIWQNQRGEMKKQAGLWQKIWVKTSTFEVPWFLNRIDFNMDGSLKQSTGTSISSISSRKMLMFSVELWCFRILHCPANSRNASKVETRFWPRSARHPGQQRCMATVPGVFQQLALLKKLMVGRWWSVPFFGGPKKFDEICRGLS